MRSSSRKRTSTRKATSTRKTASKHKTTSRRSRSSASRKPVPKPPAAAAGCLLALVPFANVLIRRKADKIARQYYKDGRLEKVELDLSDNIERMRKLTDEYMKKYGR